jgi:hypothetical protein
MKKVLFLLDGSIIHFGIGKYLQKIENYELYAIIDTHLGKKFFEQQNLINFKKEWFFQDNIKNDNSNKTLDLEYLSNFEKKYNINLWQIAYSDIVLNKYNNFYKFSYDEIILIYQQICKFFEKIVLEIKPDFLIIRPTDYSDNQILHGLCKALKIKILTLGSARLGNMNIISTDVDKFDNIAMLNENSLDTISKDQLKKSLEGYATQQKLFQSRYQKSWNKKLMSVLKIIRLVFDFKYQDFFEHKGRNFFSLIWIQVIFSIKLFQMNKYTSKKFEKNIPVEKEYMYFPLHLQPERSTLVAAPFYENLLEVIKNIAKSIPVEFILLVKEHPRQITYGWRDKTFYKQIENLPNVKLIHPSVSNEKLIENSSLVITVAGTTGLEAVVQGKPAIVFADVIYDSIPSVHKVKEIEKLPELIRQCLGEKVNMEEVGKFFKKVFANSFEFNDIKLTQDMYSEFYHSGFLLDVKLSENKIKKFLKDNEKIFEKLALEHYKKMQM